MGKGMRRALGKSAEFAFGGAGYGCLEVLWRGYTHISMLMLGGACFCCLLAIYRMRLAFAVKCVFGAAIITTGEFLVGCMVNLWLGLDVWDYSMEACQLMGQVCARYTILWCALSAIIMLACDLAGRLRLKIDGLRLKTRTTAAPAGETEPDSLKQAV